MLLSLIPKGSDLIIIDVAESTAYNRKHDIPNISYLKGRRKIYLALAKVLNMPVVNGEVETANVYISILRLLGLYTLEKTCYNAINGAYA
jgi:hypothetical protein